MSRLQAAGLTKSLRIKALGHDARPTPLAGAIRGVFGDQASAAY